MRRNSTSEPGIAGVLLAAGASRRLGRPKQLVELDGASLLERAARAIASHCDHGVICVLGAHAQEVRVALDAVEVRIVVNPDWREGIGTSIRFGVRHVPGDARAILLTVCDQPFVRGAEFGRLVADWRANPQAVVAAGYGEGFGVPAIFPAAYRRQLEGLNGDRGAKALIAGAPNRRFVDMPNADFDVDDVADLERLENFARGSPASKRK